MKKSVVLLTLVAAVSAYSQGTVNFNNRLTTSTPVINAPIAYPAGGPATAGNINGGTDLIVNGKNWGGKTAQAALYGGSARDNLVLLVPAVGFRSGAAAGFVNVGSAGERTVSGVAAGVTAYVQIRAWDSGVAGSTYESLAGEYYAGGSQIIRLAALGGGSPPLPAANLIDADTGLAIAGFTMTYVPEPSIIGLGILGAIAGLMVFRRRN